MVYADAGRRRQDAAIAPLGGDRQQHIMKVAQLGHVGVSSSGEQRYCCLPPPTAPPVDRSGAAAGFLRAATHRTTNALVAATVQSNVEVSDQKEKETR